jgi:lipopolysaccharide/colanic/teichoic acid biosynthesis glycosyltransferase
VGAAVLLVPAAPVIAAACLLVRLTSPGPVIYRQVRLGAGGRQFTLYKIRTMVADAERETGAIWAAENDPRVTAVGAFLRALHIDELPQLVNVIKGDLALVGPRPERPEIAAVLVEEIPEFWDRLVVKPGITGLAQINLPPDTDLESVRRKLQLDLEYIQRANPWLDLRILLSTVPRLVGCRAYTAKRLLRVNCNGLTRDEYVLTDTTTELDRDATLSESVRPRRPR